MSDRLRVSKSYIEVATGTETGLRILSLESWDGGTQTSHFGPNSDPLIRRKDNGVAGTITASGFHGQALLGGAYNQTFRWLRDDTGYAGHITFVVVFRFYWIGATFDSNVWNTVVFYEMQGLSTGGTATANQQIVFVFRADGSIECRRGNAAQDYNGTLLQATAANTVIPQTWHRVDARVTIADSGGAWNMRIDGTEVLNGTGDTYTNYGGASDPKIGLIYLGTGQAAEPPFIDDMYIDDILIADGGGTSTDYPGDLAIYARHPVSNSEVEGSPFPAGDNYARVDEVGQDDTDYVLFAGGIVNTKAVAKLSGTTVEGNGRTGSNNREVFGEPTASHVFTTKPNGGAWASAANVDDSTFGVRYGGQTDLYNFTDLGVATTPIAVQVTNRWARFEDLRREAWGTVLM